jgi:hypothetical protein
VVFEQYLSRHTGKFSKKNKTLFWRQYHLTSASEQGAHLLTAVMKMKKKTETCTSLHHSRTCSEPSPSLSLFIWLCLSEWLITTMEVSEKRKTKQASELQNNRQAGIVTSWPVLGITSSSAWEGSLPSVISSSLKTLLPRNHFLPSTENNHPAGHSPCFPPGPWALT